jgi:cytochrome c biogenesis protein CcmG/thiol:disulfide interchange protein DsbE
VTRPHRSLVAACAAALLAATATFASSASATVPPDDLLFGTVTVTGSPLSVFTERMQSGAEPDTAVGLAVPVVAGADYDGRPVTIDPATQGPTLVVLISHWCPHCNAMVDVLAKWRRASEAPKQLRVVGISVGADPARENFPPAEWLVSDADWRWPVIADDGQGSGLLAYGGISFPMFVLVSSAGTLVWRGSGEMSIETLMAQIDAALAAEPVG